MRLLLLYILAFIFTTNRKSTKPFTSGKILVIRTDERMGNTILTTALLAELRKNFPKAEIDFLVSKRFSPLVKNNSYNINILSFEKRHLFTRPLKWLTFILELRKKSYDISIDATHEHAFSTTGMLLTLFTDARLRIGHSRNYFDQGYNDAVLPANGQTSELKRKQRLLIPLIGEEDLANRPQTWHTVPSSETRQKTENWLKKEQLEDKKIVIIWPGARKQDRRFSTDLYINLLSKIKLPDDMETIVAWGPGEYQTAKEIARQTKAKLAPETNSIELAALFDQGVCYIGNDTGPLHLAYAAKLVTFSLIPDKKCLRWVYSESPHQTAVPGDNANKILPQLNRWISKLAKDKAA